MASATQAQSRNGRRVIRRDASPQIVSISDTADSPDLDSHELITLPSTLLVANAYDRAEHHHAVTP
jgi:hypothetical protein